MSCDEKSGTTSFAVQPGNVLCDEDGNFREAGLLENIAQTAAARSGFLFRSKGQQPPVGVIGAMSRVEVLRLPKAGDKIETTITEVAEAMGMTLIKGEVKMNGATVAHCEMKIFLNPEIPQQ